MIATPSLLAFRLYSPNIPVGDRKAMHCVPASLEINIAWSWMVVGRIRYGFPSKSPMKMIPLNMLEIHLRGLLR